MRHTGGPLAARSVWFQTYGLEARFRPTSGWLTTRPESAEHPGLATFDEHDQAVINRFLSGTLLKVR